MLNAKAMTANQARNTIGVSTLVYLVSLFMLLVLLPSCQRDAPVSPSGSSSSVSTTPDDNGGHGNDDPPGDDNGGGN